MAENIVQSALSKVRQTANQILRPVQQATQDTRGFVQQGRFTPLQGLQELRQSPPVRLAETLVRPLVQQQVQRITQPIQTAISQLPQLPQRIGAIKLPSAYENLPPLTIRGQTVQSPFRPVTVGELAEFSRENIIQPFAREAVEIPLTVKQAITKRPEEIQVPKTPAGRFFFGQEPLQSAQVRFPTRRLQLEQLGVSKELSGPLAVGAIVAGSYLDLLPGVDDLLTKGVKEGITEVAQAGLKRAVSEQTQKQATEFVAKEIEQRLIAQGIEQQAAKTQAKTEAKQLVASRVEALKATAQAITPTAPQNLLEEARKYKSPKEFVNARLQEEKYLPPDITKFTGDLNRQAIEDWYKSQTGSWENKKIYHGTSEKNKLNIENLGFNTPADKSLYFATNKNITKNYGQNVIDLRKNDFNLLDLRSEEGIKLANKYKVNLEYGDTGSSNTEFKNKVKSLGFDGIEYKTDRSNSDIEIYNIDKANQLLKAKTKEQLTNIWNQAQQTKVTPSQVVTPPVTPAQEITLQQTAKDLTPTIQQEVQVPPKQIVQTAETVVPSAKVTETPAKNPALKERKFSQTVMSSPKTVEQVKQQFNRQFYTQLPNPKTIAEADKIIAQNLDNAVTIAKSGESSALNNAISMRLVEKFQNEGNFTQARDILETLSGKPTSQGQAIQILSYWGKLTPAGAVRTAQTIADRAAREANVPTKAIPEQTVREITRLAQEAQKLPEGRAKVVKQAELVDKIYSVLPANALRQISSIQTLAQLLNPKTAIRNVLGNFLFQVGENVSRVTALPADILASLVTGKRTLLPPSIGTQARGFRLGLKEGVEDALKAVDTAKVGTQFDISGRTFRSGVLDKLERLLNLELKAPDRAFYRAAFDESLGMQMKLAQVTEPTPAMLEIAHKDALYRTFQDSSFLARMFSGLKRALNVGKEWGLGDLIIKYPKTPANLIARGIDYSPAGFVKTIMEMANPLFGKEFNQKAFAESFGRAIVGTVGLINTGFILHKLGILTGKPEEDRDIRATQRVVGTGQYKINVSALKRYVATGLDPMAAKPQPGDMLINYDWVQPFAIGVSMGANISANQNKMAKGGYVDSLLSSLEEGVSTIEQQPLIKGLANLGRFGSLVESLKQTAIGVPASFIPGVVNQLTQATDNIQRNTYDPNMLQEAVNMAKARLPYLSKQLQPMYSVYGEPLERYQQGTNTFFNIFLNPAFVTTLKSTPVGDEVLRIYQMTGETQQAPKIADRTINVNGQKMELTAQQLADYQQYIGSKTNQYFNQLLNDPVYLGLSDTERAKKMANVLTDVNTAAKIELFNNQPKTVSGQAQTILSGGQIEVTTPELKKLQAQLKKQAKIKTKKAKGLKAPKLKRITIKRIALKKVKLPKAKAIKLTPIKPVRFARLKQPTTSRVTKLKTIKVRA